MALCRLKGSIVSGQWGNVLQRLCPRNVQDRFRQMANLWLDLSQYHGFNISCHWQPLYMIKPHKIQNSAAQKQAFLPRLSEVKSFIKYFPFGSKSINLQSPLNSLESQTVLWFIWSRTQEMWGYLNLIGPCYWSPWSTVLCSAHQFAICVLKSRTHLFKWLNTGGFLPNPMWTSFLLRVTQPYISTI